MRDISPEKRRKLLITGASGLLGTNLIYFLSSRFSIFGVYHDHPIRVRGATVERGDICDPDGFKKLIDKFSPDAVLHAAALANVDACERAPALAHKINTEGTKNIVDALSGSSAKLIFVSTDQVYGETHGFAVESDPLDPLNVYARTKADAERIVASRPHSLTLRTNLFGWDVGPGRSLAGWCLRELEQGRMINGFTDVIFSSLYTGDWADIFVQLLDRDAEGVYNLGASQPISKYAFLVELAQTAGLDSRSVAPVKSSTIQLQARRGRDLSLNISKLETLLGSNVPTIHASIHRFSRDRLDGVPDSMKHMVQFTACGYANPGQES